MAGCCGFLGWCLCGLGSYGLLKYLCGLDQVVQRFDDQVVQRIEDDDDDDCVIVAEKGQVACRDFPHARHLCSNMPFGTTSHNKHCTMCYCFVCDAPAPCSYWGKGLSVDDHCHATDKETKWNTLRQAFKQRSNGSGTSNGHSAQISHPLAPTVSGARASSATRVQSGTSNAHTAQISQPVAPTVSAPRAQPAAGAGRGTSNTLTAQISHPVEPTVSAARSYSVARTGTGTSNAHTSQITHPVEPTVGATRAYSAARIGTGTSSTHTSQTTRPLEQTVRAPRVYPAVGAGRDSNSTAQQNGMAGGIEDDDDDDCVIVAEKGQGPLCCNVKYLCL